MAIGKIGEFKVSTDDWGLYVERVEQYFLANNIKNELQVSTLITVMGAECYELLVNLCTPEKPSKKTFEEISSILKKHLQPKPSILAERFKFRQRLQKEGESIAEYVAILKKMSKSCEFGGGLDESMRDQLVCGINSEIIRQRLFAEEKLDYAKAYKLAVSIEAAEKNAAIVEGQARPSAPVETKCLAIKNMRRNTVRPWGPAKDHVASTHRNKLNVGTTTEVSSEPAERGRPYQQCGVCGRSHHTASCKFAKYFCRVCNKQGHLKRVCPQLTSQNYVAQTEDIGSAIDSDASDEIL
ncbi:uncharacterized protein LOC119189450 isoform X2 [Manduca sexta]|uniref:uncharacterized protein LOC119189450 isoform X2 n=2 Tax=Manduca sexta TaxID=7130 RepID=UPI00188FECBE|nr:uncharacterized protein LOC119189450 isoform X2 [Manduca sexta]